MGKAQRRALKRLIKGAMAAGVAAALSYILEHQTELYPLLPLAVMPLVTGTLLAIEKWIRELDRKPNPPPAEEG